MVDLKRCIVALSVAYLTLRTIVIHADASNKFCGTALDKPRCEKMAKGATNWDEAITKVINEALNVVAKASTSGGPACKESYKHTEDKLKECLKTARDGNKDGTLNFEISAALTSVTGCTKALKGKKEDVAAAMKLNEDVEQAVRVCLAVDASKSAP
ncbi:PREDICTED: uncharacterized protein LOC109179527 [Ipomoea nil]|uniref:uncharacterized protein LOC109179527 n=1 Tax=Ipomoea nil TaxID=35883 RepID=UPI0009018ECE|nr:PREDICTED: uncharacterized protein LOC109179527 [Ipomoea nil]